jgi:hypothetical protein
MFYVVGKWYFANRSIILINNINTSGAEQTIRVRENNFYIYDAFIQFFSEISYGNFQPLRSFQIIL